MTRQIAPAVNPADINTNAPERAQWLGTDGAIYDATLCQHPISKLLFYYVTRDDEDCGAILAEYIHRAVYRGYKLPMPVPTGTTTGAIAPPQAHHAARAHAATRATTRPAQAPTRSQFRDLKEALQARSNH